MRNVILCFLKIVGFNASSLIFALLKRNPSEYKIFNPSFAAAL